MSEIKTFLAHALAFGVTAAFIGFVILTLIVLLISFVEWDFQKWRDIDWVDVRICLLFAALIVAWSFGGKL